jgi:hypothetical protein
MYKYIYIDNLFGMTSCLTCPNDRMYNVVCNFSIGFNHYACNPQTTCLNSDGTYDCCAKNIVSCLVDAASLLVPTVQPSAAINENSCEAQRCAAKYSAGHCYWYESINTTLMCSEDKTEYCCSQDRSGCCKTSKTAAVVTFSSVAGLILLFLCYRYIARSYSKIIPVTVETLDMYELTKSRETPNIV